MFQSLNYFKAIQCPFQKDSTNKCERPYCHFKHKATPTESLSHAATSTITAQHDDNRINLNDIQIELPKNLKNDKTIQDPNELAKNVPEHLENALNTVKQLFSSSDPMFANLLQSKLNEALSVTKQNIPTYTPTPIKELNRNKSRISNNNDDDDYANDVLVLSNEENEDEEEENGDDDSSFPSHAKRKHSSDRSVTNESSSLKRSKTDLTQNENETENFEIKKMLTQKTESVLRKMSNPLSMAMATSNSASLKIDRLSLNQQLMKRYEIVNAERVKNGEAAPAVQCKPKAATSQATQKPQTAATASTKPTPTPTSTQTPKLIIDNTNKIPLATRQRYLKILHENARNLFKNNEIACQKAAEQEKSLYDRAKTKNSYMNFAANLIKSLRQEHQAQGTASKPENKMSLVNKKPQLPSQDEQNKKPVYSHEAMLSGPRANKVSYSINRKKKLTLKDATPNAFYNAFKQYVLSEKQLEENCYPREHPQFPTLAFLPAKPTHTTVSAAAATTTKYTLTTTTPAVASQQKAKSLPTETKTCKRCLKLFIITKTYEYLSKDECVHHWGKLRSVRVNKVIEQKYSCCSQDTKSEGCHVSKHVYDGDDYESNEPLTGYVQTKPPANIESSLTKSNIYALDCEMCYTTKGLELTRVSVIDADLNLVYDSIVLPDYEIIDYNTRWSGLTEMDFKNCKTKIKDVQAYLLKLFNKNTILIGHSLESDFKALKLIHKTVIDTSVVFPHRMGPPMKRALRNLTSELLQKIIQEDAKGHDPKEDACACMELMLWKAEQELK